jgi:hypothetical protein
MIEVPEEPGNTTMFARELTIDPILLKDGRKVIKRLERCHTKNQTLIVA